MTKRLRRLFPKLFGGQYRLMSGRTKRYNCLAWAAGENNIWRQAPPDGMWPIGILDDGSVESAIQFFETYGFTPTTLDDVSVEPGVIKIAIYGDDEGYTHAARQLTNGKWTSKIGKLQDIEHDTLDALSSKAYGQVVQIMRKNLSDPLPP